MPNVTTTHWRPELDGRGTFDLIFSCLATSFLCAYAALRLNVPLIGTPKGRTIICKLHWVLMGMFVPELVVFSAWFQWISARKLTERVNRHLKSQAGSDNAIKWTMTHSYYTQMGGFVFETNDPGEDAYIPGSPRLCLTAHGTEVLAKMGHLPTISRESILNRSKVNDLSKIVAVIQASWFISQCIARAAAHYPLTYLELHTLAHVASALVTWFLWWDKPLDIQDSTVIDGSWCRPVVAAMWMFSHTNMYSLGSRTFRPEIEGLFHIQRKSSNVSQDRSSSVQIPTMAGDAAIEMQPVGYAENEGVELGSGVAKFLGEDPSRRLIKISPSGTEYFTPYREIRIKLAKGEYLLPFGFGPNPSSKLYERINNDGHPVEVVVGFVTLTRWRLAQDCMKKYPDIWNRCTRELRRSDKSGLTLSEYPIALCTDSFVAMAIPNWPCAALIGPGDSYSSLLSSALFVVGWFLAYGGLHAAAWNNRFPESNDRLLWRYASLYIACSGPMFLLTHFVSKIVPRILSPNGGSNNTCARGATVILYGLFIQMLAAGLLAYLAAKFFVVVEIFSTLRQFPPAVYQTPRWSQYLPHL